MSWLAEGGSLARSTCRIEGVRAIKASPSVVSLKGGSKWSPLWCHSETDAGHTAHSCRWSRIVFERKLIVLAVVRGEEGCTGVACDLHWRCSENIYNLARRGHCLPKVDARPNQPARPMWSSTSLLVLGLTTRYLPRVSFTTRFVSSRAPAPTCQAAHLSITPPTDEDLQTLSRQLGNQADNICGVGLRCKHGFPQAFAFDPTGRNLFQGNKKRRSKLESGMFRLSCPKLVQAIDEWEAQGAVRLVNEEVIASAVANSAAATDDGVDGDDAVARNQLRVAYSRVALGPNLAALLEQAHSGHAAARHELLGERLPTLLADAAADGPEQLAIVEHVLGSGVAGQTRTKTDIKCVHAQVADGLCRSNANGVATELLQRLEERGVDVRGDGVCMSQCNPAISEDEARQSFWYEPIKNKWKLRKRNAMRRERSMARREADGEEPEAGSV